MEFLEAGNSNILACTIAWHADDISGNFQTFSEAAKDCELILSKLQLGAQNSAPALQVPFSSLSSQEIVTDYVMRGLINQVTCVDGSQLASTAVYEDHITHSDNLLRFQFCSLVMNIQVLQPSPYVIKSLIIATTGVKIIGLAQPRAVEVLLV